MFIKATIELMTVCHTVSFIQDATFKTPFIRHLFIIQNVSFNNSFRSLKIKSSLYLFYFKKPKYR